MNARNLLSRRPVTPRAHRANQAADGTVWIWAIQAVLAYEWLVSGVDKLLDPRFGTKLVPLVRQSAHANSYGWYASFLRDVVLPNHTLFGVLTEVGETGVGVVLGLAALLCLLTPGRSAAFNAKPAACGALFGSIFLSLNYFFQGSTPIPWLSAQNSLNPGGVDITILVAAISVVLLAANLRAAAAERAAGAGRLSVFSPGARRSGDRVNPRRLRPMTLRDALTMYPDGQWIDAQGARRSTWWLMAGQGSADSRSLDLDRPVTWRGNTVCPAPPSSGPEDVIVTLHREYGEETLGSCLVRRASSTETWVDASSVSWTADELLRSLPATLLAQAVTWGKLTVQADGEGVLHPRFGEGTAAGGDSRASYDVVRLSGGDGSPLYIVGGRDVDVRSAVRALSAGVVFPKGPSSVEARNADADDGFPWGDRDESA